MIITSNNILGSTMNPSYDSLTYLSFFLPSTCVSVPFSSAPRVCRLRPTTRLCPHLDWLSGGWAYAIQKSCLEDLVK